MRRRIRRLRSEGRTEIFNFFHLAARTNANAHATVALSAPLTHSARVPLNSLSLLASFLPSFLPSFLLPSPLVRSFAHCLQKVFRLLLLL